MSGLRDSELDLLGSDPLVVEDVSLLLVAELLLLLLLLVSFETWHPVMKLRL